MLNAVTSGAKHRLRASVHLLIGIKKQVLRSAQDDGQSNINLCTTSPVKVHERRWMIGYNECMHTEVLRIDPESPDPAAIARGAEILREGGLVAFPTETVYGLGANALDARAVARVFEAKGRPADNPLIVHVPDAESVGQI